MFHREDARIVREAKLNENFQCPERIFCDGETGSTVARHWRAGAILDRLFRSSSVLAEFRRRHLKHNAVVQTVAGDFMAAFSYAPDDTGKMLGHPAKGKESGFATGLIEQIQKKRCVAL